MINFEEFENYVKARCETRSFIFTTHLISHEEVLKIRLLLKQYKSTEVLKCVASIGLGDKFYVETKCDQCNGLNKERLSKTKLIEYINDQSRQNRKKSWRNQDHICPSCESEAKRKQQETCQNLEESNQKIVLENTFYYIENYLSSDREWHKEIAQKQRIDKIRYPSVNWEAISDHIKSMDYQDFLKTPYWKAIAAHTKYKAGYRCQLCNSADNLATHHRNYDIHGREHAHMQELIVLCNDCHSKFHDIEEETAESSSSN